ncbi:hypothetical protein EJB05_00051, partial [Eragrostis curvula]
MDVHADVRRHEAALRAVQKPPAKPWRGGGTGTAAPPPPPPKVYRVEPREFRDLVQRLTGAPPARQHHPHHHQMPPVQPVAVRAAGAEDHHQQQQQLYAPSWFSYPMAGMDHGGNGALM